MKWICVWPILYVSFLFETQTLTFINQFSLAIAAQFSRAIYIDWKALVLLTTLDTVRKANTPFTVCEVKSYTIVFIFCLDYVETSQILLTRSEQSNEKLMIGLLLSAKQSRIESKLNIVLRIESTIIINKVSKSKNNWWNLNLREKGMCGMA